MIEKITAHTTFRMAKEYSELSGIDRGAANKLENMAWRNRGLFNLGLEFKRF